MTFSRLIGAILLVGLAFQYGRSLQIAPASSAARGKYLVEEVAKCTECHTPRDSNGELDRYRWLQGAQTWIVPAVPRKIWAENAPSLAGGSTFSDDQLLKVLETGIAHDGAPIRPPMHVYHMTHEDATAIVAYLKTVPAR